MYDTHTDSPNLEREDREKSGNTIQVNYRKQKNRVNVSFYVIFYVYTFTTLPIYLWVCNYKYYILYVYMYMNIYHWVVIVIYSHITEVIVQWTSYMVFIISRMWYIIYQMDCQSFDTPSLLLYREHPSLTEGDLQLLVRVDKQIYQMYDVYIYIGTLYDKWIHNINMT